jgi:hypothetical protein
MDTNLFQKIKSIGNLRYYNEKVYSDTDIKKILSELENDLLHEVLCTHPQLLSYDLAYKDRFNKEEINTLLDAFINCPEHCVCAGLNKTLAEELTGEMYRQLLINEQFSLDEIPRKFRTKEMCEIGLQVECDEIFRDIPKEYKTLKICELGVTSNTDNFKNIPKKFKTPEMMLVAIKSWGGFLQYIPDHLKTEEMCLEAIKNSYNSLEFIPVRFLTKEFCVKILQCQSLILSCLSEQAVDSEAQDNIIREHISQEIIENAIEKNGNLLEHLPIHYKTKKICYLSINSSKGSSISYFPPNILSKITEEQYMHIVRLNYFNIRHVPRNRRSKEMNDLIQETGLDSNFYSSHLLNDPHSQKVYDLAVQRKTSNLYYIPNNHKTKKLCELAFQTGNNHRLVDVPFELRTIEFCEKFNLINDFMKLLSVEEFLTHKVEYVYKKVKKEKYECPVLLESSENNEYAEFDCGHAFDEKIINRLIFCPVCNIRLSRKIVKILFENEL